MTFPLSISEFIQEGIIMSSVAGKVIIGFGKQQRHHSQQENKFHFYSPDFFLTSSTPWITCENIIEISISELLSFFNLSQCENIQWTSPTFLQYEKTFEELQRKFVSAELQKAVPFLIETTTSKMTTGRLKNCLQHLLHYAEKHPVYVYGIWNSHDGILGATPEVLFKKENLSLETMACAGTCDANTEMFLKDPKELYEHQLVVQGIVESLSPYGKISKKELQLLSLPNLTHLVTPIKVKLNQQMPFESVVKALHPTPALGAWPREKGKDWLKKYQMQIDRKRFGAPIGFVNNESNFSACYVAIRNVQWDNNGMQIAAGSGVVPQSSVNFEWQEIQNKISAIKRIMHL